MLHDTPTTNYDTENILNSSEYFCVVDIGEDLLGGTQKATHVSPISFICAHRTLFIYVSYFLYVSNRNHIFQKVCSRRPWIGSVKQGSTYHTIPIPNWSPALKLWVKVKTPLICQICLTFVTYLSHLSPTSLSSVPCVSGMTFWCLLKNGDFQTLSDLPNSNVHRLQRFWRKSLSGAGLWKLEILQEKGNLKQIYASKEFLSFVNYFRLAWTGLKGRTETLLDAN